jgi:hypothetical protein
MNPEPDADDPMPDLPPSAARSEAEALVATFNLVIEKTDTASLKSLRRMLLQHYSTDPQQAELLDVLDGETLLRTASHRTPRD